MSEPLRKCPLCGLEAWTEADLEAFVKDKNCPHGRSNTCKECKNAFYRERYVPKPKPLYLRKCVDCGLEAWTEEDLEKFVSDKNRLYGKKTICKNCHNERDKRHRKKRPLKIRYKLMIHRCYDENDTAYERYGGRGITVCEEWLNDRQTFIDWALVNGFKPELQIDRINNEGSYSPENCRWVTPKIQALNRRNTVTFLEKGTRICYKCKIEKPFSEFYRSSRYGCNGYVFICKVCAHLRKIKRKHSKL